MAIPTTEQADPRYRDVDTWRSAAVAEAIIGVQRRAVDSVAEAGPALADAADALALRLRAGGRMAYAGAGSSGMLAQIDALEMPGTYGIGLESVPVLLAGGQAALLDLSSGAEDDADEARDTVDRLRLARQDSLVALSASGRTPYALAALRQARRRGAMTVSIACNPDTPLLAEADYPIWLDTPPEVIAGSTRMAAGTAQKCALNVLSTLVGIRLGHAFAGLMVNMRPDNAKLKRRAVGIVAQAAGVGPEAAETALARAGDIKTAVLLCSGMAEPEEARRHLERNGGDLRAALPGLAPARSGEPCGTTSNRR